MASMITLIPTGIDAFQSLAIRPSDHINYAELQADQADIQTIPSGARYVLMESTDNTDFYVAFDETAAVPGGQSPSDTEDGDGPMLNPALLFISGKSTISLISETACRVMLAYYK